MSKEGGKPPSLGIERATYGHKLELTRGSYQAYRTKFSTEQAQPQARQKSVASIRVAS
jgi:hypothetical protein